MLYHSTNNPSHRVELKEAILRSLPPDNGLYMPDRLPVLGEDFWKIWRYLSFEEIGYAVAEAFFGDDVDHAALKEIVEATGAPTAAGTDDADALPVAVDRNLEHGDTVAVDGFALTAVHLRGHTPGSIAFVYEAPEGPTHIFSGDSLFPGGVGNTQKDPERFTQLLDDVTQRLFGAYPDDTVVHPGHGKPTTLGAERPHLEEWRARGW